MAKKAETPKTPEMVTVKVNMGKKRAGYATLEYPVIDPSGGKPIMVTEGKEVKVPRTFDVDRHIRNQEFIVV